MLESGTYRVAWTGVLTSFDPNAQGFGPELPLDQRVSAPITIEVPPLEKLTVSVAERVVRLLAEAINDPARDTTELEPYILHGHKALRAALVEVHRKTAFAFTARGDDRVFGRVRAGAP